MGKQGDVGPAHHDMRAASFGQFRHFIGAQNIVGERADAHDVVGTDRFGIEPLHRFIDDRDVNCIRHSGRNGTRQSHGCGG